MGGATLAAALAPTGRRIVILERGERLADCAEARDDRAIFARGHFRPEETWFTPEGEAVQPGQLLLRRRQLQVLRRGADPLPRRGLPPARGTSAAPRRAGRSPTTSSSPGTRPRRSSIAVRGDASQDPTEPPHSGAYPFPPVPDEPAIADRPGAAAAGRGHAFVAAARRRHRTLAGARRHAVGRLSRHDRREDGRRERRGREGARAPERHAGDRRARHPAGRRARTVA